MTAAFHPSPRFSQEIFDLILEKIGEDFNPRWPSYDSRLCPDYRTMARCARVSKAWYATARKYIWATLTINHDNSKDVASLFSALSERPSLRQYIKHVKFRNIGNSPVDNALCLFLAPVPSVEINIDFDSPDESLEVFAGDPTTYMDEPQARAIASFLHSPDLTSFMFSGELFYTGFLENAPNLRDLFVSLDTYDDVPVYAVGRRFHNDLNPLLFRLRRAVFKNSTHVFANLLHAAPQVFLELEELVIGERNQRDGTSSGESLVAGVLSLAKETIRRVFIGQGSPLELIRALNMHDVEKLNALTSLSITTDMLLLQTNDSWSRITTFLDSKPNLLQNLQEFQISIRGVSFYTFKDLADWDDQHPAWKAMQTALAPDRMPNLRKIGVRGFWCYNRPCDVTGSYESRDLVSAQMEKVFLLHFPTWEGDTRNIQRLCKLIPEHE